MNKIEEYGWKQKSPKVWTGKNGYYIKIKEASRIAKNQQLRITSFSQRGFQSGRANSMEEAYDVVKWFMAADPQDNS